jgi:hypothetical protein
MIEEDLPDARETFDAVVQHVNEQFTEQALRQNDGKEVPLRLENNGPIIGKATLRFDSERNVLMADFVVEDPKLAELLKQVPPNIFMQ